VAAWTRLKQWLTGRNLVSDGPSATFGGPGTFPAVTGIVRYHRGILARSLAFICYPEIPYLVQSAANVPVQI
jgi:hypothetical protein